jgi:hypothetical protein
MTDVTVYFKGWNSSSQGWGGGSWGQDEGLPSATANIGTISIVADANVVVEGVTATGSIGSVTVIAEANIAAIGVAGTGAVSPVTVIAESNAPVTGLEATSSVGTD